MFSYVRLMILCIACSLYYFSTSRVYIDNLSHVNKLFLLLKKKKKMEEKRWVRDSYSTWIPTFSVLISWFDEKIIVLKNFCSGSNWNYEGELAKNVCFWKTENNIWTVLCKKRNNSTLLNLTREQKNTFISLSLFI